MIIYTSICANYLHKARTLAVSVKKNISDAKFIVCLLEKNIEDKHLNDNFDDIILAKSCWEGNFERFIFKHNIVEASTSVKAQFLKYLQSRFEDENEFVYLDPDCFVYSDLTEIKDLLKENPIVLCPHLLIPGNIEMELSSTAHGVYNLGFLAVNRSDEAQKFINWWAERLYLYCYDDIENGIFTDQKWIDLAPSFFDCFILKHHGYDFAPWSLMNSKIDNIKDEYFINGDALRFIHFSGYGATAEKCMRDWMSDKSILFKGIYEKYSMFHNQNDNDSISKSIWSYNFYDSGEKISDISRHKYRKDYGLMFSIENPFHKSEKYFKNNIKKSYKLSNYISKSISIIKEQGVGALLKKVIKKIFQC